MPAYVFENPHELTTLKALAIQKAFLQRELALGEETVKAAPLRNIIEATPLFPSYNKMSIGEVLPSDKSGMLFIIANNGPVPRVVTTKNDIINLLRIQGVSPADARMYYADFRDTQNIYSNIWRTLRENEVATIQLQGILKIKESIPTLDFPAAKRLYLKIEQEKAQQVFMP